MDHQQMAPARALDLCIINFHAQWLIAEQGAIKMTIWGP